MKTKLFNLVARVTAVATIVSSFAMVAPVRGADIETASDTLTRLQISTAADHDIRFLSPTGAGDTTDTITLTFESFVLSTGPVAVADIDLAHSVDSTCTAFATELTLAAAADATNWGAAISGQVLTFTHPTDAANQDIPANRCIQVQIGTNAAGPGVNQIVNPGSTQAGGYEITFGGTFGDVGGLSVAIVDSDQVTVKANVDPSITFDLDTSGTTDGESSAPYEVDFGTLDPTDSVVNVSGDTGINYIHMDLATNATGGAVVTIQNANGTNGMVSTSDGVDNIANADETTVETNEEAYGFCVGDVYETSGASMTIAAGDWTDYSITCADGADGNDIVALSTSAENVITVSGPVNGGEAYLIGSADASVLTEAHDDYTDTLTFIATATF